jgi:hypothetical protein
MKKSLLLLFALLSISLSAQQSAPPVDGKAPVAQSDSKPQAPAAAPQKSYRQFESEMKNGSYQNRYFGFSYKIPEGWDSHDEETKKRLIEMGQQNLQDEKLKKQQTGPDQGFFFLLMTTPKEVIFPQVTLMAQDVVLIPHIKTGGDFIDLLAQTFKQQPGYSLLKETAKYPIGDREFYRSDFKNGKVLQTAIFTIMRRHAVGFIVSAATDEDLQAIIKTVDQTKFETPKDTFAE